MLDEKIIVEEEISIKQVVNEKDLDLVGMDVIKKVMVKEANRVCKRV